CINICSGTESRGKNQCTQLSKKVAARGKEAMPTDFIPPDEHVKRVTKHFCDWVMSLGGGNCSIDEDTLVSLLSASCEREATVPSPFHAVKFNTAEAVQSKSQKISPPQLAIRSSHHLRSLSCQVKEMEVIQLHSTQAFKDFLERKGYRKPWFLLKMLAGGNDSRAPEETSKACKKVT
ncbi:hypothetical protein N329_06328, partial [Haliaeetus albicilla]